MCSSTVHCHLYSITRKRIKNINLSLACNFSCMLIIKTEWKCLSCHTRCGKFSFPSKRWRKKNQIQYPQEVFFPPSTSIYMCVHVFRGTGSEGLSTWLFICSVYIYVSGYGNSQISIYMQIVHHVSNSHVCLLGVDEMCSMQSTSAHQEWAKSSRAESVTVAVSSPPTLWQCQTPRPLPILLVLLLIREPASQELGREVGKEERRRRRPGSSLGKEQRK